MQSHEASPQRDVSVPGGPPRADGVIARVAFWLAALLWLWLLVALTALALGLLTLYRGDRILPGVHVLGADLGGRTTAEAANLISDAWRGRTITLDTGAIQQHMSPDELGLALDAAATGRLAHDQGRRLAGPDDVRLVANQLLAAVSPRLATSERIEIAAVWRFERDAAAAALRQFAQQLALPARDATIRINQGRVEWTPSQAGQALDIAAALASLEQRPVEVLQSGRLTAPVVVITPTLTDVSAAVAEANRLLAQETVVRLYDPINDERLAWTVDRPTLGGWLALTGDSQGWIVDEGRLAAWVAGQAAALGALRYIDADVAVPALAQAAAAGHRELRLRVFHRPQTHIVRSGETLSSIAAQYGFPYPGLERANPELGSLVYVGQRVTIPSPDELLPLPVVENKRIVVSLSGQWMRTYENGKVKWTLAVSTGIPSSPTSPGVFQVQSHEMNAYAASWDLWMPYFMGIYRPVPGQDFMNGFHGFPTCGDSQLLWTNALGRPVTFGCILLSNENAARALPLGRGGSDRGGGVVR